MDHKFYQLVFVGFYQTMILMEAYHMILKDCKGNMRSLGLLNFFGNQLEGKIPVSFREIPTLEQLDLSKNNLDGENI